MLEAPHPWPADGCKLENLRYCLMHVMNTPKMYYERSESSSFFPGSLAPNDLGPFLKLPSQSHKICLHEQQLCIYLVLVELSGTQRFFLKQSLSVSGPGRREDPKLRDSPFPYFLRLRHLFVGLLLKGF